MAYVPPTTGAYYHTYRVKLLLSECSTWQTLVGAERKLTKIGAHQAEWCELGLPCAVVHRDEGSNRTRSGTGGYFQSSNLMAISFYLRPPKKWNDQVINSDEDKILWTEDVIGTIVLEMEALQSTDWTDGYTHLSFTSTTVEAGPFLVAAEELPSIDENNPYSEEFQGTDITAMQILLEASP